MENYAFESRTTIGDMIDGAVGNLTDEEIDRDMKTYARVGRIFGKKNYDDCVCILDSNNEYDPAQYSNRLTKDATRVNIDVYKSNYESESYIKVCVERLNGNTFLYFRDDNECEDYINMINEVNGYENN